MEKIKYYKDLSLAIEKSIEENSNDKASIALQEYSSEIENGMKYCFKAILDFQNGDIESSINELLEGTKRHPFNYNIHYNIGFMFYLQKEYIFSLEYFFQAAKYSATKEDKQQAIDQIKTIISENIKENKVDVALIEKKVAEMQEIFNKSDAKIYPLDENRESIIRKVQQRGSENEFMVNMYKSLDINNVDSDSRMYFKSELVKGNEIKARKVFNTKGPVVIPISQIDSVSKINIKVNNKSYSFDEKKFNGNQFHYIRINEPGKIEIITESEIFVGNLIEIMPEKKPVKLFLKVFIDGLSYQFLEDNDLEVLMPNTYRFFKEGFISRNTFTTSEWTLPSKASINTGVYATKHMLLHPNYLYTFSDSQKLLAEYFQGQKYYCTNICTNWRTTPALGYYRGYDRIIYQNFLGGMDSKEVIMETIEHLMSFQNSNNFMTISLMDLHNVPDEIENHLYSQVNTDIADRINKGSKGSTSVQTEHDESKIAKYYQEIKRMDRLLGILYDYVMKNYSEDDFVLLLHSDHGQSFLENEFNLLSDNRLKIPFMMRGKNVPTCQSDELIETVDILPAILKCCELDEREDIDGQLPKAFGGEAERNYTFTQIIHPNQPYKVLINEEDLSYYLETKHLVLDDLTICLEDYRSYIVDKESGVDVTEQHIDKLNQYDEIVFSKIKNMLRWSN